MDRRIIKNLFKNDLLNGYYLNARFSDLNKTPPPRGFILPYHVNCFDQFSEQGQNYFVITVIELDQFKFISWGIIKKKREQEATAFAGMLGRNNVFSKNHTI